MENIIKAYDAYGKFVIMIAKSQSETSQDIYSLLWEGSWAVTKDLLFLHLPSIYKNSVKKSVSLNLNDQSKQYLLDMEKKLEKELSFQLTDIDIKNIYNVINNCHQKREEDSFNALTSKYRNRDKF